MKTWLAAVAASGMFVAGLGVGLAAQQRAEPAAYHDKAPQDAARALLDIARAQADNGSWELIAVGRVHYLGGDKAQGQAIFDALLAGKHEDSDVLRIARVYREAGDWARAKPLFDAYVARNPKDKTEIAEVGAYYLLQGDRAGAEALFDRSFAVKPELWATVAAAGAYLGVAPQQ
jgi:tetratricopeptide (TPR) repeat protein